MTRASSKAKAIPINVDGLYEKHRTVLRPQRRWDFQQLALGNGCIYPVPVLRAVLDRMERTAGGPVSHR
jgi:hypothetical protein